jgi:hypothetical protein
VKQYLQPQPDQAFKETSVNRTSHQLIGAFILGAAAQGTLAATIVADGPYNFRDNSIGILPGMPARDLIVFGMFFVSPDTPQTTATFFQRDTVSNVDVTGPFPAQQYAFNPWIFEYAIPYSAGLTGAWNLEFRNGTDVAVRETNPLGDVPSVPLAENVTFTGVGASPTVHWDLPALSAGVEIDYANVIVFERLSATTFDFLHLSDALPVSQTSYTIPSNLINPAFPATVSDLTMVDGRTYVIAVALVDSDASGLIRTRSLRGIDYTTAPIPEPATTLMMLTGLAGIAGATWARRRRGRA